MHLCFLCLFRFFCCHCIAYSLICLLLYNLQGIYLCRGFVITELVHLRGRVGTDTGCAGCRRVERTVQYSPRCAIRTSQRVRTHSYIHIHVSYRWLYIPYILVHMYSTLVIVRGTRWYEPVIPVLPVAIGVLITTKLDELKTALDASRAKWRCK